MNENIDLTKILKDCPEGTELWSDNYGEVQFLCILKDLERPIVVKRTDGYTTFYTQEGWFDMNFPASCLLWPSKDCRDWSKFTTPWLKKDRFDPKTLRPFDKVLVSDEHHKIWRCSFFSHIVNTLYYPYIAIDSSYKFCIPYNDDTKYLVGTTDEAPEYYRFWED